MLWVQDDSAVRAKIDECIRENAKSPAPREAMDAGMGPVDEFTSKKCSAFPERAMMDPLTK